MACNGSTQYVDLYYTKLEIARVREAMNLGSI